MLAEGLSLTDGTGGLAGTPIPNRAVNQLGGRYESGLVRGLLETRYFERGAYPSSLSEIADEAASVSDSLTPSRLAAYYYVVRDDEVVLLAPVQ
jgi:hypothetical protein